MHCNDLKIIVEVENLIENRGCFSFCSFTVVMNSIFQIAAKTEILALNSTGVEMWWNFIALKRKISNVVDAFASIVNCECERKKLSPTKIFIEKKKEIPLKSCNIAHSDTFAQLGSI